MSDAGGRRPVTIVVPLYDDLAGIEACVTSLLDSVDFSIDRVLLSNDSGPHADDIERRMRELVGSHPGFTYHRNRANLGFVGNCNQAVFELDKSGNDVLLLNSDTVTTAGFVDEMVAVLDLADSHGVVTARSNNATIASIPDRRRNPHAPRSLERTREVFEAVSPLLPRFTIAPVAMGFCFLVRRSLIDRFGFFDEAFAPGYGEENDFCLRLNGHGYRSVLANRALVYHTGSTSFSGDRGPSLRFGHEKILVERYPFYVGALQLYQTHGRDPVDTFADVFTPGDEIVRVAVDLPTKPTARLLESVGRLVDTLGGFAEITVISPRSQLANVRRALPRVGVTERTKNRAVYDLVIGVGDAPSLRRLVRLNLLSPRWVLAQYVQSDERRWSDRVTRFRSEALERISSRFADAFVDLDDAGAISLATAALVQTPIDVEALRARWQDMADLGFALGVVDLPQSASVSRRLALYIGARSPRLSRRLRSALRR